MSEQHSAATLLETEEFDCTAALLALIAEIGELEGQERHSALVEWCRSEWWSAPLMMLEGQPGQVAREAYKALQIDLAAETPGRRWHSLPAQAARASIIRLLGLDGHFAGFYGSLAFKAWQDDDGRNWIAGAVGCQPHGHVEKFIRWEHLDIRDVILWDPRTNEAMLAGEHRSTSTFVLPDIPDDRLKVWGDCGAFFRTWAAERSRVGELLTRQARGEWVHPVHEPSDGGLPGAFLIGDYMRARWPSPAVRSVAAKEGIAAGQLHFAVTRAANLPQIEGA